MEKLSRQSPISFPQTKGFLAELCPLSLMAAFPQALDLIHALLYYVDWWDAWEFEATSRGQMTVSCLISMQLPRREARDV